MDALVNLGMCLLIGFVMPVGGYALLCAINPYRPCRRCRMKVGNVRMSLGFTVTAVLRRQKWCHSCKGNGVKLRLGRRMWNYWLNTRAASLRADAAVEREKLRHPGPAPLPSPPQRPIPAQQQRVLGEGEQYIYRPMSLDRPDGDPR